MTKKSWFERLIDSFGGDKDAVRRARSESKHGRGSKPAPHARAKRRQVRKAQRAARKAQRGRR